jgi:hypothetical protein
MTDNPASCEMCAVIHFLHAENECCGNAVVYGPNVMSKGTERQWCRMFSDGQTNGTTKTEVVCAER